MTGGYTGSEGQYEPVGIVHKGEYVIFAPYTYPKWYRKVRRFMPDRMASWIGRQVRVYDPKKDIRPLIRPSESGEDK